MDSTEDITHIRTVYAELPPFVIPKEDDISNPGGFMPAILKSLASWMNISVTWMREPEDKYGSWENNNWTGMCGMLFRNEVDVIVNPLLPSAEYAEVAYYTNPIIFEAYTFLSGRKKQDGGLFLYFSVLEPFVWFSIGMSLIAIAFTSSFLFQKQFDLKCSYWVRALCQYLWVYLTYMLRQAPSEKWMLRQEKSLLSTLLLTLVVLWILGISFLVMTVFQSLLVSKLTIIRSDPIVDSIQDFVDKHDVKGLTPKEIEIQEALKDSGIPAYEKAWTKIEPELVTFEESLSDKAFRDVASGKTCLVNGRLIIEPALRDYFVKYGRCEFHLSQNHFFPFPLLMGLRKNLPAKFQRKFNSGLTRLVDADISGKWMKSITKGSQLCTSYTENDLKPLELKNIFGVLVIWGAGMLFSILCFTVERYYFKSHQQEKLRVKKKEQEQT